MAEDRDPLEPFTDDESAFLRHVRFGDLPARVPMSELVELAETEERRDRPETAPDRRDWE